MFVWIFFTVLPKEAAFIGHFLSFEWVRSFPLYSAIPVSPYWNAPEECPPRVSFIPPVFVTDARGATGSEPRFKMAAAAAVFELSAAAGRGGLCSSDSKRSSEQQTCGDNSRSVKAESGWRGRARDLCKLSEDKVQESGAAKKIRLNYASPKAPDSLKQVGTNSAKSRPGFERRFSL